MTLLVRDEADIVDANLAFHLNAGVDYVVVTDNASVDGTTEILERYVRGGHVHLIHDRGSGYRQPELVTRMARLAAADYGADWVLNIDADEFWWPRGGNLKDVLQEVPTEYGVLCACVRHFVPRPAQGTHFAEAMTVRFSPPATFFEPASVYRPMAKVLHRGNPSISIGGGNHLVFGPGVLPVLRGWYPIEVLHFPWRSAEQVARKARIQAASAEKMRRAPSGLSAIPGADAVEEWFEARVVGDEDVEQGIAAGTLARDTRLRDALRGIADVDTLPEDLEFEPPGKALAIVFQPPSLVEEAAYAVDTAVLTETEVVRAQKRIDLLEKRVAHLEGHVGPRLARHLTSMARRLTRRNSIG